MLSEFHHRAILDAIQTATEKISEGSFYGVLASFKGADNNLIEQVNQVRKYRNWVSHGKRGKVSVNPSGRGSQRREKN